MIYSLQIRFWLILFIISLFLTPWLRGGSKMHEHINSEVRITQEALGERWSNFVLKNSLFLFKDSPVSYLSKGFEYGIVTPEKQENERVLNSSSFGRFMFAKANSYFNDFIQACFVACVRFLIVICWFGILSPLIVAACYDGVVQRIIKNLTFGSTRTATFSITLFFVLPLLFAPLFYLTAPFTVNPAIVPLWVCICLVPISIVLANSQPLFGKN